MGLVSRITPCLWYADTAEEAATAYCDIFPNSRIVRVLRYDAASARAANRPKGSVLTVEFELDRQSFTALNGGPLFRFNESISFVVRCDTQDDIDHYWDALGRGGDPMAQQCGWLKDRFGVSWQVVPAWLPDWLTDADPARAARVMRTMLAMRKLDLAPLQAAYDAEA
ncbi:VOC family protein [Lysobacter claricitrinus]|uniref:VOC family protein n=1 Tax=Lysobacter claricitrinus TaxID=3367728 RepID=UPI0038B25385